MDRIAITLPRVIKAVLRAENKPPTLILGLSGENVTRLMADEPILIDLAALDLPAIKVVIVGGRTENAILEQLVANGVVPRTT